MRHIDLAPLLVQCFADDIGEKIKTRLDRAQRKSAAMLEADRKKHITRNGPNKWKPIKDRATAILGKKCWYTELELIGAPLVVDHYRPVNDYWWLAYDPENYRISCPWANSPEHNANHGCAGGKGDNFPLVPPTMRALAKIHLVDERPIILDPCNAADCELLAFQADGRPVLNPAFAGDAIAMQRVEESKIFLNLDHPDFNAKREKIRLATDHDVKVHEGLGADDLRQATRDQLAARIVSTAPFSTAARFYLQAHRHLDWVQAILDA